MAALALITGTLFWLVVFFFLMAAIFVLIRDGFGVKGALEAAMMLGLMVVLGMPLHMIARRLSGRAIASAGEAVSGVDATPATAPRRRRRGRGRR